MRGPFSLQAREGPSMPPQFRMVSEQIGTLLDGTFMARFAGNVGVPLLWLAFYHGPGAVVVNVGPAAWPTAQSGIDLHIAKLLRVSRGR